MKIALFYNPQSFDAPPQGTVANIPNVLLQTRIIDLHFFADSCVYLHSFFSGGRRKTFLFLFQPFKVIQGH